MTDGAIFSEDPSFLYSCFTSVPWVPQELCDRFDLNEEAVISHLCDASLIQDGIRMRALRRARIIARALIDEKGDLDSTALNAWIALLQKEGYVFYPEGMSDSSLTEHMLSVLLSVRDSKEIGKRLRRFQLPLLSSWSEELIFQSLGVKKTLALSDLRIAILTACLFPLRQNVGSCFATAPAILIQSEQLKALLDDFYQLLFTGKLKRTFGGVEYAVPLSLSTGAGDLYRTINGVQVWLSPGLILGFESIGLIPSDLSWEKKGERMKELFRGHDKAATVENLIHQVLLNYFEVTDEDLRIARQWEISQAKNTPFSVFQPPSQKVVLANEMLEKEKLVTNAFKGLCDNALLKAWEFTLASFSEVKMEFSSWNLYTSLGLYQEKQGGIGEVIYQLLNEKLQKINLKIQEAQEEYQLSLDSLRAAERLLSLAGGEAESRRLQAECQSRAYHMRMALEMRDGAHSLGSQYASLPPFLIKQYELFFPLYFQEVYDAQMQDCNRIQYEDSPAGFRLVYKHGRIDPSQWSLIHNEAEYSAALADFFSATESQIAYLCDWKGGEAIILELTSAVILHVQSPEFLKSASLRTKDAHRFLSTDLGEKKPWAYTSGGTMTTLLKTYFSRPSEFTEESRWVENESELLIFLLDTLKNLPAHVCDAYLKNPNKKMLIASPSHAFLLQPGWKTFMRGWQEGGFTYTFVRDEVFLPSQKFYAEIRLNPEQQQFLSEEFCKKIPLSLANSLGQGFHPIGDGLTVIEWRRKVFAMLSSHVRESQMLADTIDAFLYKALPVVSAQEVKIYIRRLFVDLMDDAMEKALAEMNSQGTAYFTAKAVKDRAKGIYLMAHPRKALPIDLHAYVEEHAGFIGLSPPSSCLFADTNWVGYYFGFVVNPGTGRLELWRLNRIGSEGFPMSIWQHWLNGSDRKPWTVYTHPGEYQIF